MVGSEFLVGLCGLGRLCGLGGAKRGEGGWGEDVVGLGVGRGLLLRLLLRLFRWWRRRGCVGQVEWFKVNQAVFQKFKTALGGIVSARLYHTAEKHTTLIL